MTRRFGMIRFYKDDMDPWQDQERLIVLLFDSAIENMKLAIKALDENDYKAKSCYINNAQSIINQLDKFLDMEDGGKLAINLRRLYHFINDNLSNADIEYDSQLIRDALTLTEKLNKKWKVVMLR